MTAVRAYKLVNKSFGLNLYLSSNSILIFVRQFSYSLLHAVSTVAQRSRGPVHDEGFQNIFGHIFLKVP